MPSSTVDQLRTFYKQIEEFDELPHSFDDTLIDKLLDHLDFDAEGLPGFIEERLSSPELDSENTVPLTLTVRLFEKAMRNNHIFTSDVTMAFCSKSIDILHQPRPLILWSAILKLYCTIREIQMEREVESEEGFWSESLKWVYEKLPEESFSVFVRRDAEKFLAAFTTHEVISKQIVTVLLKKADTVTSVLVRDSIYRILDIFFSLIPPTSHQSLVYKIMVCRGAGHATCSLVARILSATPLEDGVPYPDQLNPTQWVTPSVWITVVMMYIQRAGCPPELRECVMSSKALKFTHVVQLGKYVKDNDSLISSLALWIPALSSRLRSPSSDVFEMFSEFERRFVHLKEMRPFTEPLVERALDEPELLKKIVVDLKIPLLHDPLIRKQLLSVINQGLNSEEWEHRDSALELMMLGGPTVPLPSPPLSRSPQSLPAPLSFPPSALSRLPKLATNDPSPFVRAMAIQCMHHFEQRMVLPIAMKALWADGDPQPRIESIRVLHARLNDCRDFCFVAANMNRLLQDGDLDVRRGALQIASILIQSDFECEKEKVAGLRTVLELYVHDREIGEEVCTLLSRTVSQSDDDVTSRLLTDMISALSIEENEDDVIDCY